MGSYARSGQTQWSGSGISRTEGAGLDVLNLKSGLEFSKEQMVEIATLSKFIGEESSGFMMNLINYIRIFSIEKDAFDDTISSFAMISGMSLGGSGEIGQGFDYLAGLGRQAGWDPQQFLIIQKEMIASGRDTSRFWRALSSVMADVIKDDTKMAESVRKADNSLRGLDEILWVLDESYDRHEGYVDSAAWAMGEFGPRGLEAIEALGIFVDDMHETSSIAQEGAEFQKTANEAVKDAGEIYREQVSAKLTNLSQSLEDFQTALANLLAGPLKDFIDVGTGVIGGGTAMAEFIQKGIEEDKGFGPSMFDAGSTFKDDEYIDSEAMKKFLEWLHDPLGMNKENLFIDEEPPEEESSPAIRGGGRGGSIKNVSSRRSSSTSNVTHNYITIMDNDSMLRGLLGVNLNV
jgi:hypothetical protein